MHILCDISSDFYKVQISTTDGAQVIPESPARKLQEDLDPLGFSLEGSSSESKKAGEAVQ